MAVLPSRDPGLPANCDLIGFVERWMSGAGTAATTQGRAVLAGWGYGHEELAEVEEQLHALACAGEV